MIKKTLLYCYVLLTIGTIHTSCKRPQAKQEPANHTPTLSGEWIQVSPTHPRRLIFMDNGKFAMFIGQDKHYTLQISGTYATRRDSLKTKATEQLEKKDDKTTVKTELDNVLFENATYHLKDDKLFLKYTTYPADAPVETNIVWQRVLPRG